MPILSPLSALAACALLLAAPGAHAADLAAQSRIGAVFAEPPPRAPLRIETRDATNAVIAETFYAVQPRIPGYYGRAGDFAYRNYYGTSPITIYSRLPYACGFVGLC